MPHRVPKIRLFVEVSIAAEQCALLPERVMAVMQVLTAPTLCRVTLGGWR